MGILLDSAADIYSAKNNLVEIPAGGDPLQYWDDTAANQVRNLAVEVHAALRGQLDTGKHFVGMGDNAADPDMLASLGAGVSYIYGTASVAKRKRSGSGGLTTMLDSVGDTATSSSGTDRPWSLAPVVNQSGTAGYTAWQVNVTETATGSGSKLLFDWQVGGTSKLRAWNTGSLDFGAGSSAAVSASGRGAIRFDEGTNVFQQSVNGGAWGALGGGVTDADDVVWTGEHDFAGPAFNVSAAVALFEQGAEISTTKTLVVGANTLISGDKLQVGQLSGAVTAALGGTGQAGGYAVGDMLYASGASAISKLAAGAVGTMMIGQGAATAPAWSADGVLTSLTLTSTMKLLSWTSDRKILAMGEADSTPSYRGITGQQASGANITGGPLRLLGGYSTGTGVAGAVEIWHSHVGTTGSDANTVLKSWSFTAPTDPTGDSQQNSNLLPTSNGYSSLGGTSNRLLDGWFSGTVTADTVTATNVGVESLTVSKRHLGAQGASQASANDITLGDGNDFELSGTTPLHRIATAGWSVGTLIHIYAADVAGLNVGGGAASGGGYGHIYMYSGGQAISYVALMRRGDGWYQASYAVPAGAMT